MRIEPQGSTRSEGPCARSPWRAAHALGEPPERLPARGLDGVPGRGLSGSPGVFSRLCACPQGGPAPGARKRDSGGGSIAPGPTRPTRSGNGWCGRVLHLADPSQKSASVTRATASRLSHSVACDKLKSSRRPTGRVPDAADPVIRPGRTTSICAPCVEEHLSHPNLFRKTRTKHGQKHQGPRDVNPEALDLMVAGAGFEPATFGL